MQVDELELLLKDTGIIKMIGKYQFEIISVLAKFAAYLCLVILSFL
jgi:hypothetical protein